MVSCFFLFENLNFLNSQFVPFLFSRFFPLFLIGIVTSSRRNYNSIHIWNDPGVTLSLTAAGYIPTGDDLSSSLAGSGPTPPADSITRRSSLIAAPSSSFIGSSPFKDSPSAAFGTALPAVVNVTKTSQAIQRRVAEIAHNVEVRTFSVVFSVHFLSTSFFILRLFVICSHLQTEELLS
jgi:hypothetical protein